MGDESNPGSHGPIDRDQIERCLRLVGRYLNEQGLTGEILLVGGAYMTALELIARYIPGRLLSPRVQCLVEDLFEDNGK